MANVKLSAITASSSNLIGADTLVGVHSGTTDLLFSGTQIAAFVNASPTITGHATVEGVTATGATGTGKFVFDGTPTLVTPVLGVATGTSIALGGATIGSNALAITGTAAISSTANIIGALTLGTQGTTQGSLILGNTNSTFSTTIKSSNTTSAAWVMTLPTTAGTNTYVLATDGSGVCSWAAPSAGSTSYTFTLSGNVSAAAWTTTGIGLVGAAASFTDTSSSGTVAAMYVNRLGIPTLLASSATVYTRAYGLWVEPPAASTNVTLTNTIAAGFNGHLYVAGAISAGAVISTPSNGQIIAASTIGWSNTNGTLSIATCLGTASCATVYSASNSVCITGVGHIMYLGFGDSAAPAAQTVIAQSSRSGTDSNVGGANLTLQSGRGTGTGTASSLILQAPVLAASGSGAQTLTTGLAISGCANGQIPSVVMGTAALATTATDGFFYPAYGAGAPTGVPTTQAGGAPALYIDTTNKQLYLYIGGWLQPKTPAGAALVTWQ